MESIKLLSCKKFKDNRGYFTEVFNGTAENLPKEFKTQALQVNASFSKKGTIRGMHLQHSPRMVKLITVLKGKVKFVELDVRPKSPDYGTVKEFYLDEDSQYALYIPYGYANGFQALEDSIIAYGCTGFFNPNAEISINPFSDEVKQHWDTVYRWGILKCPQILSEKDSNALHFKSQHDTLLTRVT